MKAEEFYNKKAFKHQLKRAIKHDHDYFKDCIIELIQEYSDHVLSESKPLPDYERGVLEELLPSENEIRDATFEFDGLAEKTMLRWPIPMNAPKNIAFYHGIKWITEYLTNKGE